MKPGTVNFSCCGPAPIVIREYPVVSCIDRPDIHACKTGQQRQGLIKIEVGVIMLREHPFNLNGRGEAMVFSDSKYFFLLRGAADIFSTKQRFLRPKVFSEYCFLSKKKKILKIC